MALRGIFYDNAIVKIIPYREKKAISGIATIEQILPALEKPLSTKAVRMYFLLIEKEMQRKAMHIAIIGNTKNGMKQSSERPRDKMPNTIDLIDKDLFSACGYGLYTERGCGL